MSKFVTQNKTIETACKMVDDSYTHILEFGVWKGYTLNEIRMQLSPEKFRLYGFDSFLGLPEEMAGTNLKTGAFDMYGIVPFYINGWKNTKLFPGWFKNTIPLYLKEKEDIALLHIDSDLYSSAKEILYSDIRLLIKPGTIIVFDEWYYNFLDIPENRMHEQKLFYEWVSDFNIKYELLPAIEPERQIVKIL